MSGMPPKHQTWGFWNSKIVIINYVGPFVPVSLHPQLSKSQKNQTYDNHHGSLAPRNTALTIYTTIRSRHGSRVTLPALCLTLCQTAML